MTNESASDALTSDKTAWPLGPRAFSIAFEHHPLAMLIVDPLTSSIVDANPAAAQFYGYTLSELRGMPMQALNWLSADEVAERMAKANREARTIVLLPHHLASGEVRLVEVDIVPIEVDGRPLLFSITKDVTSQHEADDVLRQSEQRFRALVEASPDAITVTDLSGRITFANARTARLHGFLSVSDMLGRKMFDLIAPEDRVAVQAAIRWTIDYNRVEETRCTLLRRDGTRFLAELTTSVVVNTSGTPSSVIGVTRDITARESAQSDLENLAHRLSLLNEIGQAITSTLDLDPMLLILLEYTRQAIGAEACSVALIERDSGELVYRQAVGIASREVIGLRLAQGQGVAGWAAARSESVIVSDPFTDPRFYAAVDSRSGFVTRNLVCVPMIAHNSVIGVIQQINKSSGTFTEDDVQLLEAVAAQTSVVIDNARLLAAERQDRQRLETLFRIGQTINSTLDPSVILDRLTDEAMRIAQATHGSAIIARPELGIFERLSLRGYSPELVDKAHVRTLSVESGINGRAYASRTIVRVDDVHEDPDYFPLVATTRSELVIPIIRGDNVLGNLDLQSPIVGAFRNVDMNFLNALADLVAIALDNARLYQQSQEHAAELEERVAERTAALQASEATARALLDTAPDASYLLNVDGYVLAANEIGARRLNRLPAQLLGHRIYDLLEPEVAAAHAQSIDLILSTGQPVRYEDERAGRYYENAIYPILDSAGHVSRVALYARDVTARRRAEEDMRRALDQERELSDLKSRFITIASHEFRTPMTTILSAAELLEHYSHRWPETKRLDYLHRIQTAVKHMVELVNDVLVVGRADAGRMDFNPAPVDIEKFCGDLIRDYQSGIGLQHQVRFHSSIQGRQFMVDEKLFRHILGNL